VESGTQSDRTIGLLVHRLLQRHGPGAAVDDARAAALVDPHDGQAGGGVAELTRRAVDAYRALSARAEVRALCESGERLHEVPFTMRGEARFLRGTIDCLVRRPDGSLTVLEFKTGRARPEHRVQADLYKRAARQLFPGVTVDALLVYPEASILV
jgi:ATP-dependent exoDNAse (exonuclease V) beta subunit